MSKKAVPLHRHPPNEPLLETGGLVERTVVTLAIYGDELDPKKITQLLGLKPTHSHRRGESKPGSEQMISAPGSWRFTLKGARPDGPEELTEKLLEFLPHEGVDWELLSEQYDIRLSYGIFFTGWNRGFALSSRLLQRLAEYHAELDFDLYCEDQSPF